MGRRGLLGLCMWVVVLRGLLDCFGDRVGRSKSWEWGMAEDNLLGEWLDRRSMEKEKGGGRE